MKQVVLNIEDGQYASFMQFLKTLNYVQILPPPRIKKNGTQKHKEKHFLSDLAGSLSGQEGDELANIVSREFQKIEGEW